jgi:hypothetical protein
LLNYLIQPERPPNYSNLYSAATLTRDGYANNHFYNYMRTHHPGVPVAPPMRLCTDR